MSATALVLLLLFLYLTMRRRGRVFIEQEEGITVVLYATLALVQRVANGSVNLDDHLMAPFYFAIPVVVGHARGVGRGATSAMVGGLAMTVMAIALAGGEGKGFPGQYVVVVVALGITGAVAGTRWLPKALKPLAAFTWTGLVAVYHPEYLLSVSAWVTQFTAIAVASLGLYLNPLRPAGSPTIHYPTSPSRRI